MNRPMHDRLFRLYGILHSPTAPHPYITWPATEKESQISASPILERRDEAGICFGTSRRGGWLSATGWCVPGEAHTSRPHHTPRQIASLV